MSGGDGNGVCVEPGRRVRLHYDLTLANGLRVDGTDDEPLSFQVGDGTLADGLEAVLQGMAPGERRSVRLTPEQAFGYPDMDNVHEMARSDFPSEMPLEPGLIVSFATPSGEEIPGTVLALEDEWVRVDFNHPLAGHTLQFEVEILSVD